MTLPTITVDIHEDNSGIHELIIARDMGHTKMHYMEVSDIHINYNGYNVMIEIKRGTDLDHSLHTGRLHNQLANMTEECDFPILIIEDWKLHPKDRTPDEIVKSFESHCKIVRSLNRKVTTYETSGKGVTVDVIEDIVKALVSGRLNVLKRPIVVLEGLSAKMKILCSFPGVNEVLAERILKEYGTPQNAIIYMDDWMNVAGLGKKKIEAIKKVWR